MKKLFYYIAAVTAVVSLYSCKGEKKTDTIITRIPVKVKHKGISKVGDYHQTREVKWMGTTYNVSVERIADVSLPVVEDEDGDKYYDNKIILKICRKGESEFFNRTFTKSDFDRYVDNIYKKHSALLGIVLEEGNGESLVFAASVGSPDKMSDEYVPLVLKISRTGSVSISKDTQMDTGSTEGNNEKSEDDLSEEEGI